MRVVDASDTVNVNLPLAAAEILVNSGGLNVGNDSLKGIDFAQIVALVRAGTLGKLVEVEEADGGKVEIWVEG